MARSADRLVNALLHAYGRTYAEDAGIRLVDRPGPLYQLLVLTSLLGKPISDSIVADLEREADIDAEVERILATYSREIKGTERDLLPVRANCRARS